MVRGVLLDFYGTLVHEDEVNLFEITSIMQQHAGRSTTFEEVADFWYRSFFALCDQAHGPDFRTQQAIGLTSLNKTIAAFSSNAVAEHLFVAQQRYWASPTLYDDTQVFLEQVRKLGLVTCIVSNADRADVDAALALHGVRVDHVVTSEDARCYKPHRGMFDLAMTTTGLPASDLVHIGDSWRSDVMGAAGVGIAAVWLNRPGRSHPDPNHPAHEVRDLTALAPLLRDTV